MECAHWYQAWNKTTLNPLKLNERKVYTDLALTGHFNILQIEVNILCSHPLKHSLFLTTTNQAVAWQNLLVTFSCKCHVYFILMVKCAWLGSTFYLIQYYIYLFLTKITPEKLKQFTEFYYYITGGFQENHYQIGLSWHFVTAFCKLNHFSKNYKKKTLKTGKYEKTWLF